MAKLLPLVNVTLVAVALMFGGNPQPGGAAFQNRRAALLSPNRRYEVQFSDPRPAFINERGKLWGTITVRDLRTQTERPARVAAGQAGRGIFEGFSPYETREAWSPDGLYLVYWDDYCMEEGSVPGGIVCHLHEIRFLSMEPDPECREELVLDRYAFGGWAPAQGHTVFETLVNEAGQKVQRRPCALGKTEELRSVGVNDPEHAIALFQNYWDSFVLARLRAKGRALWQSMSERVHKKKLSARRESYRKVYDRVNDTLTPSERETLILFGDLAELNGEGEGWVIESFNGCPCSEVAGYVDAKTGRLLFVWIMPEG